MLVERLNICECWIGTGGEMGWMPKYSCGTRIPMHRTMLFCYVRFIYICTQAFGYGKIWIQFFPKSTHCWFPGTIVHRPLCLSRSGQCDRADMIYYKRLGSANKQSLFANEYWFTVCRRKMAVHHGGTSRKKNNSIQE